MVFIDLLANNGKKAAILNEFYRTLFPVTFQYLMNTKEKYLNYISDLVKLHYLGEKDIGLQTANETVQVS